MKIIGRVSPMTTITIVAHRKTSRPRLYRKFIVLAMQYGYNDREIKNAVIEFE